MKKGGDLMDGFEVLVVISAVLMAATIFTTMVWANRKG
jgi:hypothetical protein